MSALWMAVAQCALLIAALAIVHRPLGAYMARVFTSPKHARVERLGYKIVRVDADADQRWSTYALSVLGFSAVSVLGLYGLLRLQGILPGALGFDGMRSDVAWNTAVSFVTNTNWQAYSGEQTLGYLAQAAGLTVQNFISAAVGLSVVIALIRGLTRNAAEGRIGNFWVDLTRACYRVLLPLAIIGAIVFLACGVIQNLASPVEITTLTGATQTLPGGPVASQEAIKVLGTNGGGFFGANSAHPFENPNGLSNFVQVFLILLIPSALPRTFGIMAGDKRQGWAILGAMSALWIGAVALITWAESAGVGLAPSAAGGALEGKEFRFSEVGTSLFAASTTMTSTGAVNGAHDSLTAPGGGVALFSMMLGEVSPGGVGSGLYGMLILAIVTVFIAGLMVGRTPEYLGKKIRQREMTLVALYVLVVPAVLLIGAAIAITWPGGREAMGADGPHGLTEVLYAVTSAANNNGSAFGGLDVTGPGYTVGLGFAMLLGRFVPMTLVLALAGSLSAQRRGKAGVGTLPTHTPLFITLLLGVVLVVAGLTFIPVLALGPIAEALS